MMVLACAPLSVAVSTVLPGATAASIPSMSTLSAAGTLDVHWIAALSRRSFAGAEASAVAVAAIVGGCVARGGRARALADGETLRQKSELDARRRIGHDDDLELLHD